MAEPVLSSASVSEGWGQLCATVPTAFGVTGTVEINKEHRCSRGMDPDMELGCSAGQTALWPWLAVQVTQVCMALAEAQPLDTNMVLDGNQNP